MTDISLDTLKHIKEYMDVIDVNGKKVGTVDYVKFGDEDPADPGPETRTENTPPSNRTSLVDDIADALATTREIPEAVRERMLRYGYIKIDTGILESNQYVILDEVTRVHDDHIHISRTQDDLITL